MDDKTLQVLTMLADKLGTTAEHLWGVLVRQAPISGAVDLVIITVMTTLMALWCRIVIRKTKKRKGDDGYWCAEWDEDQAGLAWLFAGIFLIGIVVMVGVCASSIIAAFFNPEYWALRQILSIGGLRPMHDA